MWVINWWRARQADKRIKQILRAELRRESIAALAKYAAEYNNQRLIDAYNTCTKGPNDYSA